jgi:hypothetical protein
MLIRPFDENDDRLAVIEKRGWHFDCVVAQQSQFENDDDFAVFYVDVPVTETVSKSAVVMLNERYLIELTKRVIEMNHLYQKDKGLNPEHFGAQVPTHALFQYKRTAVSLALEELLDELDIWIDDYETDNDD